MSSPEGMYPDEAGDGKPNGLLQPGRSGCLQVLQPSWEVIFEYF